MRDVVPGARRLGTALARPYTRAGFAPGSPQGRPRTARQRRPVSVDERVRRGQPEYDLSAAPVLEVTDDPPLTLQKTADVSEAIELRLALLSFYMSLFCGSVGGLGFSVALLREPENLC